MNCKELIENLKKVTVGLQEDDAPKCAAVCEEAATAIETLLEEREAMKKDLKYGGCDTCRYKKEELLNHPCRKCYQDTGYFDRYRWRGPTPPDRKDY